MTIAFTDYKHYPHGFRRSGDYSIKEADRIERFGHLFQQLQSGEKKPSGAEEKEFLKQLTGKSPVTAPEVMAWNKYQKKISESKQYFPLCSTLLDGDTPIAKKSVAGDDVVDGDADDIDVDTDASLEDDDDDVDIEET
jgi:uncharacterized protein